MTPMCPRNCGRPSRRMLVTKAKQPALCRECHARYPNRWADRDARLRVQQDAAIERTFQAAKAALRRRVA
jgi:cytochrome c553